MTSITRFGRTGRPILTVLLASVPFAIHFAPALADESPEDESSSTAFVAPEITGPVDVPSDEDPLDDPRLSDQGPLTEASDKIQMLVADSGMSGFGGTRIDHKMDALTLYWNGSVPEVISGLVEQLALTGPTSRSRKLPIPCRNSTPKPSASPSSVRTGSAYS
jgi:hypothetical protein